MQYILEDYGWATTYVDKLNFDKEMSSRQPWVYFHKIQDGCQTVWPT